MRVGPVSMLCCPHDAAPLERRGNSYVCAHGHSFDRAKEGYVNLLPVQEKASRDPGDSRDMVAARRRFLETGAFAAISAALNAAVIAHIVARPMGQKTTVVDAGCGEGYYLEHLAAAVAADRHSAEVELAGWDISKWAVRAAAKRTTSVNWMVASNRRPPLPPHRTDMILCVFGFPIWPGFAATQAPGGLVLMVDPGPDHLLEMREIIYPEVVRRAEKPINATDDYALASEHRVREVAQLASPEVIADLLSMTPHAHRSGAAGQLVLARHKTLAVTVDVRVRVFQQRDT